MDASVEIGARLKAERLRLDLTQTEFAAAGGVQKRSQIKYEKNQRSPSAQTLARWAAIGVDVNFVITGTRNTQATNQPRSNTMSENMTQAELEHSLLYKIPAIAHGCTISTNEGDLAVSGELAQVICAMVDYEARAALRLGPRTAPQLHRAINSRIRGKHSHLAHPNRIWQIDAARCVVYARQVWRCVIVDYASGWIYVEYLPGEELCPALINAMQPRSMGDVMQGVPRTLLMDHASAGASPMMLALCETLCIETITHAPGNAPAVGQAANARTIIERQFEAGLKFRPVGDLAELNALAADWRAKFNRESIHRGHCMTRTECWLRISHQQLFKAPAAHLCRELMNGPACAEVTA